MRKIALSAFQREIKKDFIWEKDSRVAVLLEHSGYWWKLSERFRHELTVVCDVMYLEADVEEVLFDKQVEKVCTWKPDGVIGIGGFDVLQRACQLRNFLTDESVPILLFSGKDRWQMLEKESVWIRNQEGETLYWGYQREHEKDVLVLTDKVLRKKRSAAGLTGRKVFDEAVATWKCGIEHLWAGDEEIELPIKKRILLEELAEPMRICYGIPMEIGLYYAILYLYRIFSEKQKQRLCTYCKVKNTEGCLYLEKIAHQVCAKEIGAVILPLKDVFKLTQMAMEGIENLPLQQQLSWQQVENFYRELC